VKRLTLIAALLCTFTLTAAAQQTPAQVQEREKARVEAEKAAKNKPAAAPAKKVKFTASAIQVAEFKPADIPVPAQFEMAMYEETINKLTKVLKNKSVYRDGDTRAAAEPDLVTMKCVVYEFKEGSARKRQVTSVTGATILHVHVHMENAKGEPLVDKDVTATVEMMGGENIRVTRNLANNIAELVNANF
jgi:hypothetical protein